eukprot:TRINITY_DN58789_c0_g1_i1.p2 TRINITY_DN58789_c0_g1~~TRINITY_DN58789_c0_g1_i1.p2  ORF type:complete len:102 (+),score=1.90 TRINITY_DN58789_c0_g1_i1:211-516(+)
MLHNWNSTGLSVMLCRLESDLFEMFLKCHHSPLASNPLQSCHHIHPRHALSALNCTMTTEAKSVSQTDEQKAEILVLTCNRKRALCAVCGLLSSSCCCLCW